LKKISILHLYTCAIGTIFRRNRRQQQRGEKLKKNAKKGQVLRKKVKKSGKIGKKVKKSLKKRTGFLNSDIGVKMVNLSRPRLR